jgi:hypothetical protein
MSTKQTTDLEMEVFSFLVRKYIQQADMRQKAMGLQYTTAETHDLAKEIARFILRREAMIELAAADGDLL